MTDMDLGWALMELLGIYIAGHIHIAAYIPAQVFEVWDQVGRDRVGVVGQEDLDLVGVVGQEDPDLVGVVGREDRGQVGVVDQEDRGLVGVVDLQDGDPAGPGGDLVLVVLGVVCAAYYLHASTSCAVVACYKSAADRCSVGRMDLVALASEMVFLRNGFYLIT
ncbi:uncharacterized protein LOC131230447 [Magnolia sinica]|uniref:uncharacterized protein LOC131230447 n=1 Tax=Magnolia sinica TaxID=86752 RepID=UPI002658D2DC|nr:uncharacterized protein LOC131230447 [Magnolia sinica]